MLVVRVGDRGHPAVQVKLPCVHSTDGRSLVYTGGPGGWFRQAQIVAVRTPNGWKSRIGCELTVESEDGRRVFNGRIDGDKPC